MKTCCHPFGECVENPDYKFCERCQCYLEILEASVEVTGNTFFGHPEFYKILDELKELHSRKNQDYANEDPLSNLKMCERGGLPSWKGVIVRLTDKLSRLLSFMQRESYAVKDESVEDTLKDTAVYAILGLILYRESKIGK